MSHELTPQIPSSPDAIHPPQGTPAGLVDGAFLVQRNVYAPAPTAEDPFARQIVGKKYDEGGWNIVGSNLLPDRDGNLVPHLTLEQASTGSKKRDVPFARLLSWQRGDEAAKVPSPTPRTIGGLASRDQAPSLSVETPLQKAMRLHEGMSAKGGEFDAMFADTTELDAAVASLSADDKKRFNQWSIEGAAIRTPSLGEILGAARKDGNMRVLNEEQTLSMENILDKTGLLAAKPTEEEIKEGIQKAKQSIRQGSSRYVLGSKEFIDEKDIKSILEGTRPMFVRTDGSTFYLNPDAVVSADSFDSWSGRNSDHMLKGAQAGRNVKLTSLETIEDFASRDTALPALGLFDACIILSNGRNIVSLNGGTHRVAAAMLRGEPIGFSSFALYDLRKQGVAL